MTPQKQLFKHNPPETFGDCHRTCLACLLDLSVEEVPNWAEKYWEDTATWDVEEDLFLSQHGLSKLTIAFNGSDGLEPVLAHMGQLNANRYYLLTGESKNGTNHVVICLGGKIIWDPAIDNSGIVGPATDGFFWLNFLTPLSMVNLGVSNCD